MSLGSNLSQALFLEKNPGTCTCMHTSVTVVAIIIYVIAEMLMNGKLKADNVFTVLLAISSQYYATQSRKHIIIII